MLQAARKHWLVENQLHWVLDVAFDEDRCRAREGFAAENLAVARQVTLNLLKLDTTVKAGYVPDNGCSAKPLARSALSDCFIRHSYFLRLEITYKHEIGNKNVLLKKSP